MCWRSRHLPRGTSTSSEASPTLGRPPLTFIDHVHFGYPSTSTSEQLAAKLREVHRLLAQRGRCICNRFIFDLWDKVKNRIWIRFCKGRDHNSLSVLIRLVLRCPCVLCKSSGFQFALFCLRRCMCCEMFRDCLFGCWKLVENLKGSKSFCWRIDVPIVRCEVGFFGIGIQVVFDLRRRSVPEIGS